MIKLYTAKATAKGGRDGVVTSGDGKLKLNLSMPKELYGEGKEGTNPEQLFAAAYAACFDNALNIVAKQKHLQIESEITAEVSIGQEAGGFGLSVTITGKITGVGVEEAYGLMESAHIVCPYSKAIMGNVDVTLTLAEDKNQVLNRETA
ncbi:MAG: organic hydroperoxide resistance protein [Bacteroidota bacterium]|nr:organic hydroperoxide resistance protein [Bacteroidota bacterium]